MDEGNGVADLFVLQRTEPSRLCGWVARQDRMAWMTRMSASRVITVSPPGRRSLASIAINRSVLWIHSTSGELHASTAITLGSSLTRRSAARSLHHGVQ
jgi:hypothetical protein